MVEVGDEGEDGLAQGVARGDTAASEHPADQDAEPQLDLVEPGGVLGRVEEGDAVGRIAKEGGARGHRPEDPGLAFHAEVVGEPAPLRDEADEGFGLVGVELVGDEEPGGLGIGVDGPGDVRGEVGLGPGRPERRGQDGAGGDIAVGDQAERPVADVLVLAALGAAGTGWLGRGGALR